MQMHLPHGLSNWIQAGTAVTVAAVSLIAWASSTRSDVKEQSQQIAALQAQQSADHDRVVTLSTKVDDVKAEEDEIRDDVKQLVKKQLEDKK